MATAEEDAVGKDLIVATDKGEIGLQVKSGHTGYVDFKRKEEHSLVALVLVKVRIPDRLILKEILSELEEIRQAL